MHCKCICKNSAVNRYWLFIASTAVQRDWKQGFLLHWLSSIYWKAQLQTFIAVRGLNRKSEKTITLYGTNTAKDLPFLRRELSPALVAQNSIVPLMIFIPCTPIFPIQYQLPSCYSWGPPTSSMGKLLSTRWVSYFASSPIPRVSSDLKICLIPFKLTWMLIFPLNTIYRLNLLSLHMVRSEWYRLLLVNNFKFQYHSIITLFLLKYIMMWIRIILQLIPVWHTNKIYFIEILNLKRRNQKERILVLLVLMTILLLPTTTILQ